MSTRPSAVQFLFPGMESAEEKRAAPADQSECEVCGRRAHFGYRYPGWEALRSPCRWRCLAHRIEDDAERGE